MNIINSILKDETVQRATGMAFGVAALGSIAYLGCSWSQIAIPLNINGIDLSMTGGFVLFAILTTTLVTIVRGLGRLPV